MNLQENIIRIKEMMGIINEGVPTSLLRRIDELPKYIRSTYNWLNPKAFNNLHDFVDRVAFSATRDFISEYGRQTYEKNLQTGEMMLPFVKQMIYDDFMDEIKEYYLRSINS